MVLGKNISKSPVLIISVVIIAILFTGRLSLVLKEKDLELKASKSKLRPLQEELLQAKKSLEDKALQETTLKNQVSELQSYFKRFNEKIGQSENMIKTLSSALKAAKAENDLLGKTNRRSETDSSSVTKKLNAAEEHAQSLKGRLSRISESNTPLTKRALELSKTIDLKEAEIAKLKQAEASLKDELGRIKSLSGQVVTDGSKQFKDYQDKLLQKDNQITELSNAKASLTEQLQGAITKLAAFTNDNDYLAKQVNDLGMSKNSVNSEILDAKTALAYKDQELKQKVQELETVNALYNNLKIQLSQLSDMIINKELELNNNRREMITLKAQLNNIQSKYGDLETELNLAKQQQRRTMDELNKVASINSSLQHSLTGLSQSMTQEAEDREKASDLKKKVEVILTTQGQEGTKE